MESGIGFPTLPFVGFGVAFLDFDNDAQLDIAIANGHILDNAASIPRRGRRTCSGSSCSAIRRMRRFGEVGRASRGRHSPPRRVSRGLAVGRHRQRRRPRPARHQQRPGRRAAAQRRRESRECAARPPARRRTPTRTRSARGFGSASGSRTQIRDVKAGSSYLSQNDLRAHFGLGDCRARRSDRGGVAVGPDGGGRQRRRRIRYRHDRGKAKASSHGSPRAERRLATGDWR